MNNLSDTQAQIVIRCPQCGGDIGFLEESRAIRCQFCGTSLIIAGREGILRFILPVHLQSPTEAQAAAAAHLQGLGKTSLQPGETFLFHAPFWQMQGSVYRWVFGLKPEKVETKGNGLP